MHRFSRFFIIIFFFAFICSSCDKNPPSNQEEDTRTAQVEQNEAAEEVPHTEIVFELLEAYYAALEAEDIDESQFYAPEVSRFFNSKNVSRTQVGSILRNGFEQVEDRRIILDPESFNLEEQGDGFVCEFGGEVSFKRTKSGEEISETFRNRVHLNGDYRITAYESLESQQKSRSTGARALNAQGFADQLLEKLKSGDASQLESVIHPNLGLFVVTKPGLLPMPTHYAAGDEIPNLAALTQRMENKALSGNMPDFDCDSEFSRTGCFYDKITKPFAELTELVQINETARFEGKAWEQLGMVEQSVQFHMIDTPSYLSLWFGQIDGNWYLLVLDAATFDCGA